MYKLIEIYCEHLHSDIGDEHGGNVDNIALAVAWEFSIEELEALKAGLTQLINSKSQDFILNYLSKHFDYLLVQRSSFEIDIAAIFNGIDHFLTNPHLLEN